MKPDWPGLELITDVNTTPANRWEELPLESQRVSDLLILQDRVHMAAMGWVDTLSGTIYIHIIHHTMDSPSSSDSPLGLGMNTASDGQQFSSLQQTISLVFVLNFPICNK